MQPAGARGRVCENAAEQPGVTQSSRTLRLETAQKTKEHTGTHHFL